MKKSRLLFILPLLASFVLTSCDLLNNLNFGGPRRRSSKEESSQIVEDNSQNNYQSSYNSHKHSWSEWIVTKEPTCTESGVKEHRCVECGYSETKTINRLNHNWESWIRVAEPTCTETGLEERVCSRCDARESRTIMANGHQFEDWGIISQPTCTDYGIKEVRCIVCGQTQQEYIPPAGHSWGPEEIIQEASCEKDGYIRRTCYLCGEVSEEYIPAYGHDLVLVGGEQSTPAGECHVRLYRCNRCFAQFMGFGADETTAASKTRLVVGAYGGMKFFGRPIGNSLALDASGSSVHQQNNECVYCSTETGDFFEYVFTLNAEQASVLSTCRLYCDAKPADYLTGDFWAYGRSNEDWTPGFYIDGSDAHVQHNDDGSIMMVKDHTRRYRNSDGYEVEGSELDTYVPMGARVADYRYVLYVDDVVQDFDSDTSVPVSGSGTNMVRAEYVLPYTFHLHEGRNKIRLCMAGGYRSEFYNFIFRPYIEPTPVTVNETSLEIREGKTAKITSSMTGLTFKSSSTSICTVDQNGLVTGVKTGTATITVSKEGNYKDAKVAVTVLEKEGVISIALDSGVLTPEDGATFYNSASSGLWLRNFQKDTSVTYTFQSEFAGLFDIQLGLRGSGIDLATNFNIKVNGVDVAISGTVNTSYNAVEYVVGLADLKVGENVMVITALESNAMYLKTLKLIPHVYVAFQTYSVEDLEANRTDSGWLESKDFGEAGKAFKFNKAGSVTVSYVSAYAQKAMLQLKIAVKQSNNAKTGFWVQDGMEKTRITINDEVVTPNAEPDFTGSTASTVNDNGIMSIPEWYDIIEIDLVAGSNTIKVEYLQGGYTYYLGGIAIAS